jgi:hypothetical protein
MVHYCTLMCNLPNLRPHRPCTGLVHWQRVKRHRRSCEKFFLIPFFNPRGMCADERILGSGDFVERVIRAAEARMQRQYTARERGQSVERLIAEECKKRKVSLTELRSGSRRGVIAAFRGHVSRKLVEGYGIPIAEVARQVGVSTSAISKSLRRNSSWSTTSPF